MTETEAQRAARVADKYVAPDGGPPERPKKGKGAGKPYRPDPDGTTIKELLPPKPLVRKIGRPATYSKDLVDEIIERVAGGETIVDICKDDHMPEPRHFYRWLRQDPELRQTYAQAQVERTYVHQEQLLEIADNGTNDWMEKHGKDSEGWQINGEAIARSRLRIDTRKWLMAKLNASSFAERQFVEHSGTVSATRPSIDPRSLPDDVREALREACRRVLAERDGQTIDVTPEEGGNDQGA